MDFISNLTNAQTRTGLTEESLEQLERVFRQALGNKQELSFEDFKKIVHSKNTFFAERVFQIFDGDKSGSVSLSEFLGAMQQFAGQSPNDKFKFLFKVYDIDENGFIQQEELQQVLQACMEENGMKFSKEQIEDLTQAMFDDAESDNDGNITYEALKAQLEKHSGLLENLSISIDRWLVPPQPTLERTPSLLSRLKKLKPYQLSLPYIKNNYVFLSFLVVFFCINVSLFISRAVEYRAANAFTVVARACGQCLNFNCMMVLVMTLRQCITFLRTHGAGSFLPLDQHIYLHKLCGWFIFVFSLVHALMHLSNFGLVLQYQTGVGEINENNCSFSQLMLSDCPRQLGLVAGWANPTGVLITIILTVMVVCSQPFVRKSGYFQVFYWTHFLYVGFFTLTILHAPRFWQWFIVPGILFIIERAHRAVVMHTGRGHTYVSSGVLLPSKVTNLVIQRPVSFQFHPGDYVFVNIPAIAKYEWHPFTLSSAPEQDGALWMHIRAVGEWTNRLHAHFEQQQQQQQQQQHQFQLQLGIDSPTPIKAEHEDAGGNTLEVRVESGRELVPGPGEKGETPQKPRRLSRLEDFSAQARAQQSGPPLEIFIDGPYGAPSSHIFRAQHAVLIATGIGVTPFASILQSIMHKYLKARHSCPKCQHSWTSVIPRSVMNLKKVDFFWINRDQRSFEWFVDLLSRLEIEQAEQGGVLDRFLDMHMYITSALQKTDMKAVGLQLALDLLHERSKRDLITGLKTRTNAGRPNWDKVFRALSTEGRGKVTVFYCGPPTLARTLRYKCDEYGFEFRKEIF